MDAFEPYSSARLGIFRVWNAFMTVTSWACLRVKYLGQTRTLA